MSGISERWDHHSLSDNGDGHAEGRDPVEELAAEFAERYRAGERVSVEEYATRHPELADQIRDLFPTIAAMEQLHTKRLVESGMPAATAPKQLGDYRIIAEIARGGMGIVYEAEQKSLGRRVAVKVLPAHALRRERDIRRFEREAQTAAKLHHSNIVPVFGIGEENGQRYIVMQLIRGVGLDEILREIKGVVVDGHCHDETKVAPARISTAQRSAACLLESELKLNSTSVNLHSETVEAPLPDVVAPERPLTPLAVQTPMGAEYFKNVARIGLQAAEALEYAHKNNTLHRDIKPGNLLLDEDSRVWIADFGLAKALQDDDVTCSGDIVGTMAYVAPERFQGKTTKASDIYSLGVTLHEMLTLQKAFDGDDRVAVMNQVTNERLPSPRKINKAVPRDLETIVLKAASQHPDDRYRSAAKLASDLEAFLEDRPIQARRLSHAEHVVRWSRRNPGMAVLGAAVMLLMATVFGLLMFGYRHSDQQRQRAEATSKLAVDALDEIYDRFAVTPISDPLAEEVGDEFAQADAPQIPISKDVAALLENLLEFYDKLAAQTDDSDIVAVKYVSANRRVGDINLRLGQLEDARLSYMDAINRIEQLGPAIRDTRAVRLESARAQNGLGLTFSQWSMRSVGDGIAAHQKAVQTLDDPNATSAEEQFELATSLYLLHRAQTHQRRWNRRGSQTDDSREALQANLDRALRILGRLRQHSSARGEYDLLLARCLLAVESSEETQSEGALSESQSQAIAILEDLIQQYPENPDYRFELGNVYKSIENPWRWRKQPDSPEQLARAASRLRSGLAVTADLETQHPNIPKYYLLKKHLHEFLGSILRKQGKLSEAEEQYVHAIKMQKQLMNRDGDPDRHLPWLYSLQLDFGKLLREANDLERARESLTSTVAELEQVVADEQHRPASPSGFRGHRRSMNHRTLEAAYFALACVLEKLGESESAQEVVAKAENLDG